MEIYSSRRQESAGRIASNGLYYIEERMCLMTVTYIFRRPTSSFLFAPNANINQ